jgi:ketose-bisphosphate aldolase
MSLYKVGEILKDAKERGYGVPAYDVMNYESMRWVVDAAEVVGVPAILMLYPSMKSMIPFRQFVDLAKSIGKDAKIPVSIHLDHSLSVEEIEEAIDAGFMSVMYDGSKQDFDTNVRNSYKVVQMGKEHGVDVEAELGIVGSGMNVEDFKNDELYTKPEQAVEFVERTGVGSLAVAIGNSHGVYIEQPNLDIARLSALNEAVSVPLVLHGTSGIPEEQLREAVLHGITKTNIATEFYNLMGKAVCEYTARDECRGNFIEILNKGAKTAAMDYLIAKFRLLNPNNVKC